MVSPRGRVRGDSNQTEPFQHSINCLDENEWGGNLFLPQHVNNFFDETAEVPSLGYVIGHINAISFPIAIDTGAGKSLLNEEIWRKINITNKYELRPAYRGFQAVNGSRINCLGSAVVQLMLMGEDKNYIAYFQFYIVDSLSVDALLGIDEIFRHNLRINTKDGFVRQDNVGKLLSNIIYRTQYDIGSVKTDENITCEPMTTKPCRITKTIKLDPGGALMEPLEDEQPCSSPKL